MIETLIVIALAGILSTMSVSYLIAAAPHSELERAEIQVTRALMEARNDAISNETQARVEFDPESQEFWVSVYNRETDTWVEQSRYGLSERVELDADAITFDDNRVSFTPRGTLVTGGQIGLVNSIGETTILTGSVPTGRFQLEGGNLR